MANIGVIGSDGAMGKALREVIEGSGHDFAGGADRGDDVGRLAAVSDVLVDFSAPGALQANYIIVALHSPFCYGLGITAMEIVRARGTPARHVPGKVARAMFRNALVIGIALGLVANLSDLSLPGPVTDALDMMVQAALPAALFGMGGVLCRYRPQGDFRVIAYICAVSLLLHPTITWSLGTLFELPRDAFRSAVLTAAMAPGINAYVFANMYGRAKRVAASAVLIATALSVGTAWLWLAILP